MAVLNKIRERSVFLISIIALALFAFILSGLIKNGGFITKESQNRIASINDTDINREDFARQVEAYQRNMRGRMTNVQAVNQVWNSTVRRVVLEDQIEELGIEVGKDQIDQVLKQQFASNPNFQNQDGVFDFGVMKEYVANLKATSPQAYAQWLDVEDNVAEQAKANIYMNMVRAGIGASLAEGEESYKLKNESVDLQFALIPYASVKEPEVSKEEIKAYINEHKKEYEAEASRDIQYVLFEEKPSDADNEVAKKNMMAMMNDRVEYNEVTKMDDSVKGFKNTTDNKLYIEENSDLPFDEKYHYKADLPKAQAEQIFNLNEGETYGPYLEDGYFKVAKVTGVKQIPDSVKVRHILISYAGLQTGQGLTRTKDEAKKLADSILGVVKKNQDKFADLAKEFSADGSSKEKGGDLGWVNYKNVSPSTFIDHIFSSDAGNMAVVETEYGFHVTDVEEVKNKQRAIQVAILAKKTEASEKTSNDLFAKTTKFQIAAEKGNYNDMVKKENLEARPVKGIKEMQENIPGIDNQRRIVQWVFNEDTKVGDVKRFDVGQGYVVVQVTATNPKGLMSVEEASPKVSPILRKEKQAEIIKGKIKGSTIEEIANSQGVSVETANAVNLDSPTLPGATKEPKVVGAAFSLKEGMLSEPIAGNKGVYVVKLLKKNPAKELPSYKTYADELAKSNASQVSSRLVSALKDAAEIEDNRAKFY